MKVVFLHAGLLKLYSCSTPLARTHMMPTRGIAGRNRTETLQEQWYSGSWKWNYSPFFNPRWLP